MTKTDHHADWLPLALEHFDLQQIIGGLAARYPAASDFVFQYEGGYVNDPDDPGGCTNMGITIGTLRAWRGDPSLTCDDVKALTKQEAGLIYATNYWAPIWGNQLDIGLNTQVYDFGVNAGPGRAIHILQECVGSPVDGIMGPNTLAAAQAAMAQDAPAVLLDYHDRRQAYYEGLSTFPKYGDGWTARNDDCLALARHLRDTTLPKPTLLVARVAALENWAASFRKETA